MLFKFIVSVVALLLAFNAADAAAKKQLSATKLQKMGLKAVHKFMNDLVPEPGEIFEYIIQYIAFFPFLIG